MENQDLLLFHIPVAVLGRMMVFCPLPTVRNFLCTCKKAKSIGEEESLWVILTKNLFAEAQRYRPSACSWKDYLKLNNLVCGCWTQEKVTKEGDVKTSTQFRLDFYSNNTYKLRYFFDVYDYDGGYDGGYSTLIDGSGKWRISGYTKLYIHKRNRKSITSGIKRNGK